MSQTLRAIASSWLSLAMPAVVIEVVEARGSAPRDAGTRMLVAAEQIAATIGGGHLELKAIAAARAMLDRGDIRRFPGDPPCPKSARCRFVPPPTRAHFSRSVARRSRPVPA